MGSDFVAKWTFLLIFCYSIFFRCILILMFINVATFIFINLAMYDYKKISLIIHH